MNRLLDLLRRLLKGSEIACDPSTEGLPLAAEEDTVRKERDPVPVECIPIEFVDLSATRAKTRALLRAARYLFGDMAHSVSTPRNSKLPSQVIDPDGNLIAYCWIDPEDGKPEFKPWCGHCTN
jgi:hypothetical protein